MRPWFFRKLLTKICLFLPIFVLTMSKKRDSKGKKEREKPICCFLEAPKEMKKARISPLTHVAVSQYLKTNTQDVVRRGLFGLGIPELAVIAGVAALIFGENCFLILLFLFR